MPTVYHYSTVPYLPSLLEQRVSYADPTSLDVRITVVSSATEPRPHDVAKESRAADSLREIDGTTF